MKKISIFLLGMICLVACTHSGSYKTTTMNIHDESGTVHIKSSGRIRFNADQSAITSMSPYGYLEYSHNKKKMRAEADGDGNIDYSLQNGYQQLSMNEEGRRFIAAVLHDVIRRGFEVK